MDRDVLLTIACVITFPLLCLLAPVCFIAYNLVQIFLGNTPPRQPSKHAKTMIVLGSGAPTCN